MSRDLASLQKQIAENKRQLERLGRAKASLPNGDYIFDATGGITAELGADGRTLNIDGSSIYDPPHIYIGLSIDNEAAPYIEANIATINFDGAHTTNVSWQIRENDSQGAILDTRSGDPFALVSESSIFKGGTFASPLLWINNAGDIWVGVSAENSNGRKADQVSEVIRNHNLGSFSFEVDGSIPANMEILARYETDIIWDMGDGNVITTSELASVPHIISHTYAAAGAYTITITMPLPWLRAIKAEGCGITSNIKDFSFVRDGVEVGWVGATNLQTMQLRNNGIAGDLPAEFGEMGELSLIDLRDNLLTGSIPSEWGESSTIGRIFISNNPTMGGTIPVTITNLPTLTAFDAENCGLYGSLPEAFGNRSGMTRINVNNNNMEGSIPASYALLGQMDFFNIGNNSFTGDIPAGLGNWAVCRFVFMNDNQITGSIPTDWTGLSGAQIIRLQGNQLSEASNCMPTSTTLTELRVNLNEIDSASVDYLAAHFDAQGHSGGTLRMEDQTPSAPPVTSSGNITSLQGKGWTVVHDT